MKKLDISKMSPEGLAVTEFLALYMRRVELQRRAWLLLKLKSLDPRIKELDKLIAKKYSALSNSLQEICYSYIEDYQFGVECKLDRWASANGMINPEDIPIFELILNREMHFRWHLYITPAPFEV